LDKAAHQGKSIGLPEREGRRGKKDCFFDTSEATILLKTKDGCCQKGQKQTDLQAQISPKMHSKSAIFANLDLICASPGPNCRGLDSISNPFRQAETRRGWCEARQCLGKDVDP
jgi:hypothetical protein